MKRRDFLLFAGVTATTWKPAASEITRIGFIQSGSRQENQRLLDAFSENLSALGWTDGNNIAVFDRWAEARTEALPAIMKELIGSGVAVLVTAGTPVWTAAWQPGDRAFRGWWRVGNLTSVAGSMVGAVSPSPDKIDIFATRTGGAI